MIQTPVRFKKGIAIELRKKGLSYSDIQNLINVPKSTIAYWLKGVKLSDDQVEKLKKKRSEIAKSNSQKRAAKILKKTEEIKKTSAEKIGSITQREFWLMGVVLYWRERFLTGSDHDLQKGVRFTSSDFNLIKLFLKWLQKIGKIKNEEIAFDIFLGENKKNIVEKIKNYWSKKTGFSKGCFPRVYFYKISKIKKTLKNRNIKKTNYGLLRIRVKASSMLARQIFGWIEGIKKSL